MRGDARRVEPVDPPGAGHVLGDEARLLEHLEVLGHRRAADRQRVGQLADRAWSLGQAFDDGAARGVTQRAPRLMRLGKRPRTVSLDERNWRVKSSAPEGLRRRIEERALGLVAGQADRRVVGLRGLGGPAQAAQQVGPDRVEDVVARPGRARRRGPGPRPGPRPRRPPPRGSAPRPGSARSPAGGRRAATICRQSVSAAVGASLCTALIAACSWYGPGWLRRRHRRTSSWPSAISVAVPQRAVLVGEQHQLAVRIRRGPAGATPPAASARAAR